MTDLARCPQWVVRMAFQVQVLICNLLNYSKLFLYLCTGKGVHLLATAQHSMPQKKENI